MSASRGVDLLSLPKISDCFHLRSFLSEDIILADDGSIGSVFQCDGLNDSLFDDAAMSRPHLSWQRAVSALNENCFLQVMSYRDRLDNDLEKSKSDRYPLMEQIRNDYHQHLFSDGMYDNQHYVFLWYRGTHKKIKTKKIFGGSQSISLQNEADSIKAFRRIKEQFQCQLIDYGCRLLSLLNEPDLLLYAISLVINGGNVQPKCSLSGTSLLQNAGNVSSLLGKYHILMDDVITFKQDDKLHYASVLSLNHYPGVTFSGCCSVMESSLIRSIKLDTFIPMNKSESSSRLNRTISKYLTSDDDAKGYIDSIRSAKVSLAQDEISLGLHQQSIMLISESRHNLKEHVNRLKARYMNQGTSVIEENLGLPLAFWGLCPAGIRYLARLVPITSDNFVDLCPLRSLPGGHEGYSGVVGYTQPLAWMKTVSKTAYRFNCHLLGKVNQVPLGHTLCVGASGSGKTVFLAWLSSQLCSYGGRLYYFDRDKSAYHYFKKAGALCMAMNVSTSLRMNPFSLPDSREHRLFLIDWLKVLCGSPSMAESDSKSLKACVDYAYEMLGDEERCLSTAVAILPVDFSYWDALSKWLSQGPDHEQGEYGAIFDSLEDTLSFQDIIYIDMTYLLDSKDPILLRGVMTYFFYRIERELSTHLVSLILDEAWSYLKDSFWCDYLKKWLPTLRKKHGHLIMATQSVDNIIRSSAASALLDNMATSIYFRQPMARKEEYTNTLMLSEKEFQIIKNTLTARELLVKQEKESVVVSFDLSTMNYFLLLLQGEK